MVEKINYKVLKKINKIEIREYPNIILAFVEGNISDSAFGLLFNYISGNNKVNEKIRMTAPVISKKNYMAFVMPSSFNENNNPKPNNPNVKIKVQSKRKLAVIKFSGYTTDNKIEKYKNKLLNELKEKKIAIKGETLLMRYNSPFAPPFLRRNEIGVEIKND